MVLLRAWGVLRVFIQHEGTLVVGRQVSERSAAGRFRIPIFPRIYPPGDLSDLI